MGNGAMRRAPKRPSATTRPTRWRFAVHAGVGAAICAALIGGGLTAAWSAEGEPAPGSEPLGGFAVGDGLEALVDPRDGSLSLTFSAGGIGLSWDSRRAVAGGGELGGGWDFGQMTVGTSGGYRVYPASGGSYEADASQPSGLAGYGMHDLVFTQATSDTEPLAARADGLRDAVAYGSALEQLGGVTMYFDAEGRAIAQVAATGLRTDWIRDDDGRIATVIDQRGVTTELDWATPGLLVVRPGANLAGESAAWQVELDDDGGVRSVTDPDGNRTEVTVVDGLVTRVTSPTGTRTEMTWQRGTDGVARAERVRTTDSLGVELSHRTWAMVAGSSSQWPIVGETRAAVGRAADYTTEVSDGWTAVRSSYTGAHLLQKRAMLTTDAAGQRVVQEQKLTYPQLAAGAGGTQLPPNWARPTHAEITHLDERGASRTATTSYEYDEHGRLIREVGPDGAITETDYDTEVRAGGRLPVGLVEREARIGVDGLVQETRHTLNAARTAVVATVTTSGRVDGSREVTGLAEFEVRADGFVTEQRVYPSGDRAATPVTSRWDEVTDVAAATTTVTETANAGTDAETTTTTVASMISGGTTTQTDTLGNRTTATSDVLGRVVSVTDPAGLTTRTAYEVAERDGRNATVTTAPDGVVVTEERDELGRVIRVTDNILDGEPVKGHVRVAEATSYPEPGTTAVTDAWGATTTTRVDAYGRPQRVELPNGLVQIVERDEVEGLVKTWSSPTGAEADAEFVASQWYDEAGRTVGSDGVRADAADVAAVTTEYDGLGRRTGSDDGILGEQIEYDARGNVSATTLTPLDGAPLLTSNRYDGHGVGVEKIRSDSVGAFSGGRRELDEAGRVRSEIDQRDDETSFSYTPDGLLARSITSSGQQTDYEYEPATRRLLKSTTTSPVGPSVVNVYTYDDETGRLTSVSDGSENDAATKVEYHVDAFGNTTEIVYGDGRKIRHTYDEHGRRESTTDASGSTTTYEYDGIGQLSAATQHESDPDSPVIAEVRYAYDEYGRPTELAHGNGVTTRYTYTSMGDVETEMTASGGVTQSVREYTYTVRGDLATRIDRVADASGELVATTTAYEYDDFQRLRASSRHDGADTAARTISRTAYDVLVSGDVERETVVTDPGTPDERTRVREFEYSLIGELVAITVDGQRTEQSFDAAGNLVRAADGTEYTYDAVNRRKSRTVDGSTSTTEYWADGSRREVTEAGTSTRFYWDGAQLLSEEHTTDLADGGATGWATYLIGAARHARTVLEPDGAVTGFAYDADRHSNVVALYDDAGAVVERRSYADYGAPQVERPSADIEAREGEMWRNPFGYAGEYTDADGLQLLGSRMLDPDDFRFQQKDKAPEHNLFAYGNLNPIMNVDPTGRNALSDRQISWLATGLGAAASIVTIGMAVATLGWSLTVMGIIGLAAESVALGVTGAQVYDEFKPETLEGETEQIVNYVGMAAGFLSFAAGGIAALDAANWAGHVAQAERQYKIAVKVVQKRLHYFRTSESAIIKQRDVLDRLLTRTDEAGETMFITGDDIHELDYEEAVSLFGETNELIKHFDEFKGAYTQLPDAMPEANGFLSKHLAAFKEAARGTTGLFRPVLGARALSKADDMALEVATASEQTPYLSALREAVEASTREANTFARERLYQLGLIREEAKARLRFANAPGVPSGKYPVPIPDDRPQTYGADLID